MRKPCKCGSWAINPHSCGREPGVDLDMCDVCYWRKRAETPPAVAQEVVAWDTRYKDGTRWLLSRRKVELAELVREAGDSAKDAISRPLVYGDVPTPPAAPAVVPFQARVQPWMMECFGEAISSDITERNHRFFEESTELVQSTGMTQSEAHQLVDYVYGRPVGEPVQEVGGVMVTLAALCLAAKMDMHQAGETELARIWTKVETIRAKQAAKPKHSPLPQHVTAPPAVAQEPVAVPDGFGTILAPFMTEQKIADLKTLDVVSDFDDDNTVSQDRMDALADVGLIRVRTGRRFHFTDLGLSALSHYANPGRYVPTHPAAQAGKDAARLDLFEKNVRLSMELRYPDPEESGVWTVLEESGGWNDREWTVVGIGATVRAAIDAAIAASGKGEM